MAAGAAATGSPGPNEVAAPQPAPWGLGAALADRECVVVSGEPRQGAVTLASGCDPRCDQCGAVAAARLTVVTAAEGWCVASLCACAQPWHTRESAWFASAGAAWAALDAGTY